MLTDRFDQFGKTLCNRRLQDLVMLIFKVINGILPEYLRDLFVLRNNVKNLRGTNSLVVPRKNTTTFGLYSTSFTGANMWNSLPDELRSVRTLLKDFKKAVKQLQL